MSKPKLYLFVGYPGAGKTSIARIISEETGAAHLWADQARREMFGEPRHTPAENAKLYDRLNQRTAGLLAQGKSVVFDTNFNFRRDRLHLGDIAKQNGADFAVIWVTTDKALAKKRAVEEAQGKDTRLLGNMSAQDFERIAGHLQPPAEDEKVIKIDGSKFDRQDVVQLLGL
jgi:predicted kinase